MGLIALAAVLLPGPLLDGAAEPPAAGPEAAGIARLRERTRALLEGCVVAASDGTPFYTPDGKGNYRALWTRDFAYMLEGAGDLIPPERAEACVRAIVRGVRADGAAPDRVRPDLVAVYVGGPEDRPLGEPNLDNGPFLAIAADEVLRRSPPERRGATSP